MQIHLIKRNKTKKTNKNDVKNFRRKEINRENAQQREVFSKRDNINKETINSEKGKKVEEMQYITSNC